MRSLGTNDLADSASAIFPSTPTPNSHFHESFAVCLDVSFVSWRVALIFEFFRPRSAWRRRECNWARRTLRQSSIQAMAQVHAAFCSGVSRSSGSLLMASPAIFVRSFRATKWFADICRPCLGSLPMCISEARFVFNACPLCTPNASGPRVQSL